MRRNRIFLLFLSLSLLLTACGQAAAVSAPVATEEALPFLDTLTFVGDSTTAHMASRARVQPTQVWATSSRYLNLGPRVTEERIVLPETGEELTIAAAAARVKPQRLVVTLGIDYGVYYYRHEPEKFALCYEKLLDAIGKASPETTLILQSIFPVGRGSAVITNDMVDAANRTVAEIAARRGLFYLDTNAALKDSEGYLAPAYCSSADGIHLTAAAYKIVLSRLQESELSIREIEK